jgi:hypothetical protein
MSSGRSHGLKTATQALALKHLANSQGTRVSDGEARKLAQRRSLQPHLLLWTYIWELGRRAKGKGKGAVVHSIWRSLPLTMRKDLNTEAVWAARQEIVAIVRAEILDARES